MATSCIRCNRNFEMGRCSVASVRRACWSLRCLLQRIRGRAEEVRFWLAASVPVHRYDKIVRAVLETAADMREAAQ